MPKSTKKPGPAGTEDRLKRLVFREVDRDRLNDLVALFESAMAAIKKPLARSLASPSRRCHQCPISSGKLQLLGIEHNRQHFFKNFKVEIIVRKAYLLSGYALLCFYFGGCASSSTPFQSSHSDFSFVAIGDIGERNDLLKNNAKTLKRMLAEDSFKVLVVLGDNFYPIGLNVAEKEVDDKIAEVLSPLYEVMRPLGRENVHAIAGNHDYYAFLALRKKLFLGLVNIETGPYGVSSRGNRRAATRIPEWTYHYGMPRDHLYGPPDRRMQMIFFDSAILLRTKAGEWAAALDGLSRILLQHKQDANVKWRVLFTHHPFYSLGPHGGYSVWDDSAMAVQYLNSCSLDSNALGYAVNLIDHQDLCAPRYQAYIDSVQAVIQRSGVRVQLVVAGHEHNLQLLYYPDKDRDCAECPRTHIVSGAGAKANEVKSPVPAREWTWPTNTPEAQGRSRYGFVRFDLKGESLRVRFFDGKSGELLKVDGKGEAVVSEDGEVEFE